MYPTPQQLWQAAWSILAQVSEKNEHPYRTPVVSSVTSTGQPRARTVVLRKADTQMFTFWIYTDRRSDKIEELRLIDSRLQSSSVGEAAANSSGPASLHFTFWCPEAKIQFSGSGPVSFLDEASTTPLFHQLPKHSRKTYATLNPPGQNLEAPTDGLPTNWDQLSLAETDYARSNFCVIVTRLEAADVLWLDRGGNRRIKARRLEGNSWEMGWVVP